MQARLNIFVLSSLVLAGCGGGGGDSPAPVVNPEIPMFQVTTQAGAGGSLNPISAQVRQGVSTSFIVTPAAGFAIDSVAGCAGNLSGSSYATGPVNAACTVTASFKKLSYALKATASAGGSITPSSQTILHGDSAQWTVAADAGFEIASVQGCNGELSANVYRVASVTQACEVNATFKKLKYTVSAGSSAGGTMTPLSQSIDYGDRASLTLKADTGFVISSVSGCNGQLQGEVYRTGVITADCKVEALFAVAKFQVTTKVSAGGKLSLQNPEVKYGEVLQLTLQPDSGFDITTATGCGGKLSGSVFTTAPITAACTVEARFNVDSIVVFPDPTLDKIVRQALKLDDTTAIPKTKLAQLTDLSTSTSKTVVDLQGLQHATGLRVLNLDNNKITDITPLQGLPQLAELSLSYTQVADLRVLATVKTLRKLWVFSAPATDLSPLRGLPLIHLGLDHPAVLDLSPLTNMPLEYFYLWGSATRDLSPLANAPLRYVDLRSSKVQELSALKNLDELWGINLSDTGVTDLSPLLQVRNLTHLAVYNSLIQDLTTLNALKFASRARLEISGCIDQNGYSRHLEQLNVLKNKYNLNLSLNGAKRSDCKDTLVGTTFNVNAQVVDRTLQYSWQINGSNDPLHCALYLNLDDQLPSQSASPLQACATSGTATYAGYQADQFRPALWFDNGIGGEKLISIGEVGTAPTTPKLQSLDLSQITISAKQQLVAEREGLLRLHVTAAQSPLLLPQFQLELKLNGNSQVLSTASPKRLPASKVHRSLTDAYQAIIPADWMKAGLQITVLQDGVAVRSLSPVFAAARPLALRIVPIQLGDQVASLPDISKIQAAVKTYWPFSQVEVRARAPYQLKAGGTKSTAYVMLAELLDLRTIEGEGVYYYGYFKPEMGDNCCGGLGYIGYPAAVGIDTDDGEILAHELGHNFGRLHVDCGSPSGTDPAYPYPVKTVGSVGLSLDLKTWISPVGNYDLMSYCNPKHISDYNVAAVQDFVLNNPPAAFPVTPQAQQLQAASAGRGLYLAGTLNGNAVQIRTLLPLSRAPVFNTSGDHMIRVLDSQGSWHHFHLQLLQIDHQPANASRQFRVELPEMTIQRFEIWHADVMLAAQDNHSFSLNGNNQSAQQQNASQFLLAEKSNEICVNWPAAQDATVSLIYQLDGQDTVLALNETAANFCRDSTALAPGGDWRLVWRQQLAVREFRQPR